MKRNKKAMGKLDGWATVQLLGYQFSKLSSWFNPISEREQEDSGGKYSRCFVVSWNIALSTLHSLDSFYPHTFVCIVRSIAGSTPMAGWMHCGCFTKSKVFVDNPRRVLFPLIQTFRFSPNYYHYIVSNSYL